LRAGDPRFTRKGPEDREHQHEEQSAVTIASVNPATGETIRVYEQLDGDSVEKRLARAETTFKAWRATSFDERAGLLRKAARLLRTRKSGYGRLMTEEMGKPIAQAEAEAEKCAWVCEFYAQHAEQLLAPEPRESDAREAFVRFDPLGPILAVMPWNFPFWQVFRFCAPALAAGNVALLKHASNVPGCALAIENLLEDAGFPRGCFQALLIPSSATDQVIADARIRGVTLTGSEHAGRKVAECAGRVVKKAVLELGGSDPFLILEDADLEKAVEAAVFSRTLNNGQSCISAKRFIVERKIRTDFEERFREGMAGLRVGDPLDPETDIGPLAREDLVDDLVRQVEGSVRQGARLLCGGKRLERPGWFYSPAVLAGVRPGMPAADEETFGPAAAVLEARGVEEAVDLANATPYGLGASIWTRDIDKGKRLAARIEAGCVCVNDFVKSDPRLPFGGVKLSGYGRELSREGIREFVNVKTVWVE
jgi:succinate-semialdehyde dehydrogenase/glutarate-semialdehyde dehydrogenase